MRSISQAQARRIALAAQGFLDPPHQPPTMRTLARTLGRTGVLQVDSVNVLQRAHFMPLYSRMGPYDVDLLRRASEGRPRRVVEYWAHVQAFMPVDLWPVMRHRMDRYRDGRHKWWGSVVTDELIDNLLLEISDRGASTARDLDDGLPRTKDHWGWNWSTTRRALDYMFMVGDVAIAGRNSQFEIRYDLPERVIPREHLEAPTLVRARRRQGAGTPCRPVARRGDGPRPGRLLPDAFRARPARDRRHTRRGGAGRGGRAGPGDGRGRAAPGVPPSRRAPAATDRGPGAAQSLRPGGVGAGAHRGALRLPLPDRDLHAGREAHPRLLRPAVPAR